MYQNMEMTKSWKTAVITAVWGVMGAVTLYLCLEWMGFR